jgi:hypothetical protein
VQHCSSRLGQPIHPSVVFVAATMSPSGEAQELWQQYIACCSAIHAPCATVCHLQAQH